MQRQRRQADPMRRIQTFTTRRNGINLVVPAHAQRRLAERHGCLNDVLRHVATLAGEPPGHVAVISTLDVIPIVHLQRGQAVLKTVLNHGQYLRPSTRIVEVYL